MGLPKFHFDHSRELNTLFFLRVLRDFANKFALFFLPIYLYQIGSTTGIIDFFPLSNLQQGLVLLALYHLISGLVGTVSAIPSAKLFKRLTYGQVFFWSQLVRLGQFIGLYYLQEFPFLWVLVLAAVIDGYQSPMYWQAFYTLLSKFTKKMHMGQDMGILQLLLQLVAVIAPAISGAIAIWMGLHVLFLFGLLMTLLGGILALSIAKTESRDSVSAAEFFKWLRERSFDRLALSYAGKYINDAAIYIWPLYLFILLGAVDEVGYLYTLALFLALLVTLFIGSYIDKRKSKKPFYFSGGVLTLVWLAKTQVVSPFSIAIADTFDRLAANVHSLFFDTVFMKRGKGHSALSFFTYREVVINATVVLFWAFFGAVFVFLENWQALFVLASLGVVISLLIKEHRQVS